MSSKEDVLVVIGLGGRPTVERERRYVNILNKLQQQTRHFFFFDPQWHDEETNEYEKLDDFYTRSGKPKKVFAFSAGVALATVLTSKHLEIEHAHLVCGKAFGAEKIQQRYLDSAPGFHDAVTTSAQVISQGIPEVSERVTCYTPIWRTNDGVIEKNDMIIPGAKHINLPPLGHTSSIFYSLIRYLPFV
jgi:hypothetical protein